MVEEQVNMNHKSFVETREDVPDRLYGLGPYFKSNTQCDPDTSTFNLVNWKKKDEFLSETENHFALCESDKVLGLSCAGMGNS